MLTVFSVPTKLSWNKHCLTYFDVSVLWRLADGPKGNEAFEGRVELGINGEWGAVCETGWDETSVTALCEKLGQ